jgi:putative protein kinase ArgK-like GTPase of G3E family
VLSASATGGTGIQALADALEDHRRLLAAAGTLPASRRRYQAHWLVKRLREEFGRFGIDRLGGERVLLLRLEAASGSLLELQDALRRELLLSWRQPG